MTSSSQAPVKNNPPDLETQSEAYQQAHQRAEMVQGLYIHLLVYAVINLGLFGINWFTRGDSGVWWFQWPLLGWGVAVIVHLLVTVAPVFSPDWADRRAQRMIRQNR